MPEIKLSYRPADPQKDFEFARQLHHAAYKDVVVRQFGSWDEKIQDGFFAEGWNRGPHDIVLLHDKPIGVVSVACKSDHTFLSELQILPQHQGQGIGTQIILDQMEQSKNVKLPLRLQVLRLNKAQELYLRMKFQVIKTTDTHIMMEWRCGR